MKGIIPETDITAIREQVNMGEVVSDYVTLQSSGGNSFKGLCPFHDEKTPSFNVRPDSGFFHCFGCGIGGDVYTFLQKIEQISFTEAVEKLANRINYSIHYQGGRTKLVKEKGTKSRLLAINAEAVKFYKEVFKNNKLATAGYNFLKDKQFTFKDAELFDIGFAPDNWSELTNYLLKKGFEVSELEAVGISRAGSRGPIDRFRGRLMWPIKNPAGEVIGFGARKVLEKDTLPKYLNTPETVLYKKSKVLFGLDLAKKEIANKKQVVVVEGYTDVMAMHVAGIKTAVAACGTAFGTEHLAIIRRMLLDDSFYKTEIIYTFDGDAAGIAAALKAFAGEQEFLGQSYVAIMPAGLDPCEVREKFGDDGLKEAIANKVPLFEYVIKNMLQDYDLDHPEGQLRALNKTIPIVAAIKNEGLLDEYARRLAGWVGWLDTNEIIQKVRLATKNNKKTAKNNSSYRQNLANAVVKESTSADDLVKHTINKRLFALRARNNFLQRETLKLLIQFPNEVVNKLGYVNVEWFATKEYAQLFQLLAEKDYKLELNDFTSAGLDEETLSLFKVLFTELATEKLSHNSTKDIDLYAEKIFISLQLDWVEHEIKGFRSKLSRIDFSKNRDEYNQLNSDIQDLVNYKLELQHKAGEPTA